MTNKELEILTNIIGAVESGGQVYGKRDYSAYAGAYKNSPEEHTCTLGWAQNYGSRAKNLVQKIYDADPTAFKKLDTANIQTKLKTDWVATRWNPNASEKQVLIAIISSTAGKKVQDQLFQDDMKATIKQAESLGITDVGAQMMYAETVHLGGSAPMTRILNRASKPYTARSIYNSLKLDQNDKSNNNQVGDSIYQSRHDCCLKWVEQYVGVPEDAPIKDKSAPIDKIIAIAEGEVGYLEKKSNSSLDDKTANAGSANYTKYWRDIYPNFQGQAWCAIFVTWTFTKAFGKDVTNKLLGHYPYTYVPTLASMFTKYSNPQRGDIVCFYRNGEFAHTGIVVGVEGDKFTTIEGNTSGGSTIIANGGGVCVKSYYNSQLPGTKFIRPDYSVVPVTTTQTQTDTPTTTTSTTNSSKNSTTSATKTLNTKTTGKKLKVVMDSKLSTLAVRVWAGTEYAQLKSCPALKWGKKVNYLDTVKDTKGNDWYYVRFKNEGKNITGFVYAKYCKWI